MKTSEKNIGDERREYSGVKLIKEFLPDSPFELFEIWMKNALDLNIHDATAATLATAGKDLKVSARMVLLKNHENGNFQFFGNYQSKKASQLSQNPNAAMLFYWKEQSRQIRIEGSVEKVPSEISDAYFITRPELSRIAAIVSDQSRSISSRDALEKKFAEACEKYKDSEIPRPENWGGWVLRAERMEFWQGHENRLHDRIEYLKKNGTTRLYGKN